ncbi:MAG: AraC family transcriptional regulator [Bacteroidales bacterium]|nr:AraC family transcriptional regulator [Bacteroidales bacterium]
MRFSLIYAVFPVILVLLQIIAFAFFGNRTRPSGRDLEEGEDDGIPDGVTAQTRELFAKICDAMESSRLYLNPDLRMEDLISVCGSNRSYISGCINQVTGLSFPEFVNSYRVHYAQMLLSEAGSGMSLGDIAAQCGYGSHSAFARNFKKMTGKAPSEWIPEK